MKFPAVLLHIRTTASRHGKAAGLACVETVRKCRRLPGEPSLTEAENGELMRLEIELRRGK